jgi:hypothetical protein
MLASVRLLAFCILQETSIRTSTYHSPVSAANLRNNFLWPLIVGNTREMATDLGSTFFTGQHRKPSGTTGMAASTISIPADLDSDGGVAEISSKGLRSPDSAAG